MTERTCDTCARRPDEDGSCPAWAEMGPETVDAVMTGGEPCPMHIEAQDPFACPDCGGPREVAVPIGVVTELSVVHPVDPKGHPVLEVRAPAEEVVLRCLDCGRVLEMWRWAR